MTSRLSRSLVAVAAVAVVALSAGGLIVGTADAEPDAGPQYPSASTPAEAFQTNAAGKTFGRYRIGGEQPDYVPGWTDSGQEGWFLLDDWYPGRDAKGAPRANAKAVVPDVNGDIKIKVYKFDGTTVLGWATVAHTSSE